MRLSLFALIGAALAGQSTQPPAQAPPTFKVEVNYVEIDVRVTDAQGNFARDLTQTDFQVVEDGKPQTISAFTRVDLPVERHDPPLFKAAPIEPDVQSNLQAFTGRVWMIVLDDLQTRAIHTPRVQAAARQFIRRYVSANDLAAVVTTSGAGSASQDFTNSQARLVAAVGKFIGQKTPRDQPDMERSYKARNTYGALRNLAEYLSAVHGRRKAILWIGEGVDYDITSAFSARDADIVRTAMRDVVETASRQNVSLYGIDARGLGAGLDESIEISGLPDNTNDSTALRNEVRLAQDSLRVISEQTGGFAVVETNDLNASFERIVQDNSSYYVLGYYSTNEKRDGRFRKVQVRVSRPGLRVQSRDGYTAAKGKPAAPAAAASPQVSPELREALANPMPTSGVGLTISAAPFSGPGSKASVALIVEVDPRSLKFVEQNGRFTEGLEVHVLAFDQNGKMQDGGRTNAPMELSARTASAVKANGFRVTRRLTLSPGRYLIRVAARESNGGAIGTVAQNLEVPDFTKGALHLSGVTLTSESAAQIPTANPDPELKDVLPAPATAIRTFPRTDTLSIFAEVYDNQNSTPHRVAITSTVLADDGRVIFTASDERASSDLQGKKGGYGHQQRVPLTQLAPGRYVLRIEARNLSSTNAAVVREVEFRVR
jgi:VWFA-related protein